MPKKKKKNRQKKKPMYRGPASHMWNDQTREAMFWLLQENGMPQYSRWECIMRPGVTVLPTSAYENIYKITAEQMNILFPQFLLPSPDRRRWVDQRYTWTGIEAQAAFAIQQGKNYNKGNGYDHRKKGHLNTTIRCLRAALKVGFMTFNDIYSGYHKFVVAASQSQDKVISDEAIKEVEKMSNTYVAKKSKEIITETVERTYPGLSTRELELVKYTIRAITALMEDDVYVVVDTEHKCRVSPSSIEENALEYINEFACEDLKVDVFEEILDLPMDRSPEPQPAATEQPDSEYVPPETVHAIAQQLSFSISPVEH